jgi:hypothetical protein
LTVSSPNRSGETAFHLAAQKNYKETLQKMSDLPEEAQLNPYDLRFKMLRAKDKYGKK